ncbi:hypothetical protein E4U46_000647 [Claviceps purpurea]|nr:hypothetical protein E4U10_005636 [Claviceps purpurea]KAG6187751.1 hypothetical protein E4U27_007772 [Claviceps purpurea]KAG6220826.1 hypothetical protein E4U26_006376 [Claviceps purpurea]KAG6291921.1 hypothetical protein E4U46_000647 [Claviceps purpurea]
MASTSPAARLCALVCRRVSSSAHQPLPRAQRLCRPAAPRAPFSSCAPARKRQREEAADDEDAPQRIELTRMNQAIADLATPQRLQQLDEVAKQNGHNTIDEYLAATLENTPGWASEEREADEQMSKIMQGERPNKTSFWYDEDDPECNTEELEDFDEDDMTSMAHARLEEIREMRQYARLAVWEMPLLAKFAKPFERPTKEQVLRWRYTTFMGEEHPAECKVVVQFRPSDLDLTPVQISKLKKLAGTRFDPARNVIKMSSNSYEHQAQNKQHLSELVEKLIAAAKDPTDTFEDVPLDQRYYKAVHKPRFPKEWRMTEERRLELEEYRRLAEVEDKEREEKGLLVDGAKKIDEYMTQKLTEELRKQKSEVMVPARGSRARR